MLVCKMHLPIAFLGLGIVVRDKVVLRGQCPWLLVLARNFGSVDYYACVTLVRGSCCEAVVVWSQREILS